MRISPCLLKKFNTANLQGKESYFFVLLDKNENIRGRVIKSRGKDS